MNGTTQLSVDGEIIVLGVVAMVLVFEAGGDGLVELDDLMSAPSLDYSM